MDATALFFNVLLGLSVVALALVAVFLLVMLFFYGITLFAKYKILEKMGEPGWKGLIPFYGDYVLYDYVWDVKMFFLTTGISIISLIIREVINGSSHGDQANALIAIFSVISVIFTIAELVLKFLYYNRLSKAFGFNVGFAIGLLLLNFVFLLILGLGKATYLGNMSKEENGFDLTDSSV